MSSAEELLPPPGLAAIEAMFVQTAHGMRYSGGRLTLVGLSRSTLYFADRPQRVVGHLHSRLFIELWGSGVHSFADDPPNAVLSFIEPHASTHDPAVPEDVVLVLRSPKLADDELTYYVEVLDGGLPDRSGGCVLFIDSFGRPLSPVLTETLDRLAVFRQRARYW
jgi:hypothetical protein